MTVLNLCKIYLGMIKSAGPDTCQIIHLINFYLPTVLENKPPCQALTAKNSISQPQNLSVARPYPSLQYKYDASWVSHCAPASV